MSAPELEKVDTRRGSFAEAWLLRARSALARQYRLVTGRRYIHSGSGLESLATLDRLRNSQVGQVGVIVCNGPSINNIDLELVADHPYILLNSGYLLRERFMHPPAAVCAHDPYVIEQYGSELSATDGVLFVPAKARKRLRRHADVVYLAPAEEWMFAARLGLTSHHGHTSTFWALEVAFHLGWQKAIIVGMDHRFRATAASQLSVAAGPDTDHFDPGYFSAGDRVLSPNLVASEYSYKISRDAWEEDGRRIVDCTPGGACPVFERGDFARELAS